MPRVNSGGVVRIPYTDAFQTIWDKLPENIKQDCRDIGKPYGYSGQNVCYFALILLIMIRFGGTTFDKVKYRVAI